MRGIVCVSFLREMCDGWVGGLVVVVEQRRENFLERATDGKIVSVLGMV